MKIIGIDPGLAQVGYGVIEITKSTKEMLDCGIIKTNKNEYEGNRMVEIYKDLRFLIRKWNPDLSSVEKFFFYKSSRTISVVQARGVIIMTLSRFQIPIVEFPPMQIKLAMTGYGHASKDEVLSAVMRELNLEKAPKPDDASDALAMALTAYFHR